MENKIPEDVLFILNQLNKKYDAYIVGGCVRDFIRNCTPHDWDICTSARPEEIIDIFKEYHIIPTGLKHGTVTLMLHDVPYEITTFRTDGDYIDNRHPEAVFFVSSLREDLARRDFTMNALSMKNEGQLVDYFCGLEDIKAKTVRCVGNPDTRFKEDALRILRALRFAILFDYKIDLKTYNAILSNKERLKAISKERIYAELYKIAENAVITENNLKYIELFIKLIYETIGFDIPPMFNLKRLCNNFAENNVEVRLALMFDDDNIKDILKILRAPANTVKIASKIRENAYIVMKTDISDIKITSKKLLRRFEEIDYKDIMKFVTVSDNKDYSAVIKAMETCIENNEPYKIAHLAVNGNDLIKLGYEGPEIRKLLNKTIDAVVENKISNNKTDIINYLSK